MKKQERDIVKNKCNGRCAYCGEELGSKFHIDHLIPVKRIHTWQNGKFKYTGKMESPEFDTIANMLPSCSSCNIQKSSMELEHFRNIIKDKLKQLEREANYRIAKRYGMIIEKPKEIVFYFETI